MKKKQIQCGFHVNSLNIRGDFARCSYQAKFVTPDFIPVCGIHKNSVDKMEKMFKKPLCKPLACEKTGLSDWCDNTDLKVIQERSRVTGNNGPNLYEGVKVLMCGACRKTNCGEFKIIKTNYI